MEDSQQMNITDAAQHYVDGVRRGKESELSRCRRIVDAELQTYMLVAQKDGKQHTAEAREVHKVLTGILRQL